MNDDHYVVLCVVAGGEPTTVVHSSTDLPDCLAHAQGYSTHYGVAYVAKLVYAIAPTLNPKDIH